MAMRFVTEEPVRGGYPPPGFFSLPGLEQVRAMAQGLVPRPPFFRLTGIRITHATSGAATLTMPASPWLQSSAGNVHIMPLVGAAVAQTSRSVAPPAAGIATRKLAVSFMRLPAVEMEGFVARGRVIMAGPSRATVEVHVEDTLGRLVAHVVGQTFFGPPDGPPPPPPSLAPAEEPTYATPDPPFRPLDAPPDPPLLGAALLDRGRRWVEGDTRSPMFQLVGARVLHVGEGEATFAVRTTEWLNNELRAALPINVPLAFATCAFATATVIPDGRVPSPGSFDLTGVGAAPLVADGRDLVARGKVIHAGGDLVVADTETFDADGARLAFTRSMTPLAPGRIRAGPDVSERVLATVVFADMVDSSGALQRMGDAGWRDSLEKVYAAMRKELQTFRGNEVNTTGDGFVATFDSPARAVQCSRAIRDAARRVGLETRIGIHLGEIERVGGDIAGIAVHVAKRVEGAAEPGAIFVTSTVRDAAAGSGIPFGSRGMHALKGVDEEWHLFSVED